MYNPILTRLERALLDQIVAEKQKRERIERENNRVQIPLYDTVIPSTYIPERESNGQRH